MIVQHGEARFECADALQSRRGPHSRPARLDKGEGDQREWWVPPETWKAEVCAGLDPTFVARALATRGMLRRQGQEEPDVRRRSHGGRKTRCYVLTADILGSNI